MKQVRTHPLARLYRHLHGADREVRKAFPPRSLQRIEREIAASETSHRGELRVVIEGGLGWQGLRSPKATQGDLSLSRARAIALFSQLRVWDTADNCGVLIYVLMAERQLEIIADRGIHAKVGENLWQDIVTDTTARFGQGSYEQGLLAAIETITQQLRCHFPVGIDNPNELPDRPLVL
jgi:uncharacterized membrane protein